MAAAAAAAKEALEQVKKLAMQANLTPTQYGLMVRHGFVNTSTIVYHDYPHLFEKPVSAASLIAFYQHCFVRVPTAQETTRFAIFLAYCQHMDVSAIKTIAACVATSDLEVGFPENATDEEKGTITHNALHKEFIARYPTEDTNGANEFIGGAFVRAMRTSFKSGGMCTKLPLAEKPHLLAGRAETQSATLRLVEGNIECSNKADHEATNRFGGVMCVVKIFGRLITMAGNFTISAATRGGGTEGYIGATRLFTTMRCANYFEKQCLSMVKTETGTILSFCQVLNVILREFVDLVQKHPLKHADGIMEELCQRISLWIPKAEPVKSGEKLDDDDKGRRKGGPKLNGGKRPCFKHFLNGSCSKGNACPFRHNGAPPNDSQRSQHRKNESRQSDTSQFRYRSSHERDYSPPRNVDNRRVHFREERRDDRQDGRRQEWRRPDGR